MEGGLPSAVLSLGRGWSTGRALEEAIASRRVAPVGAVGGGHPTQVPFFWEHAADAACQRFTDPVI